jgi:hypothetical protein
VTAVTPRATTYILDADAGTARDYHLLKGTVTVRYTGELVSRSSRVLLSLLDDNDQAVPLVAGTNVTATYNPGALAAGQVVDHTFDFALDPDAQLNPDRVYRVRAQVQQYAQINPPLGIYVWFPDGTEVDSPPRRYDHFTNTAASDPQHNVIAAVESITFTRAWRIATLANDNRNFRAQAVVRLVRYDDPGTQPARDDLLDFELRLQLTNGQGDGFAFASPRNGIVSFSQQLSTWIPGNLPHELTRTIDVSFRPSAQLDSVNQLHQLSGEVWTEPAPGATEQRLSAKLSGAQRLLDYNGKLLCGSGSTTITAVMNDAVRTATSYQVLPIGLPTYVAAELDIAALSVSGGGATFSGSPGVLLTRLRSDGNATYNSAATFPLSNPAAGAAQNVSSGGVTFRIGSPITLSSSGASAAAISVLALPAGMGISYSSTAPSAGDMLFGSLDGIVNVPLDSALGPADTLTWSFPDGRWVSEESKPVLVRVTAIQWNPVLDRFDLVASGEVHHPEAALRQILDASPATSPVIPDRSKRSNHDAWLLATSVSTTTPPSIRQSPLDAGPNSNAALSAEFQFGQGEVHCHFPEADVTSSSANNRVKLADDLLVTAESYFEGVRIEVPYLAGDPDANPAPAVAPPAPPAARCSSRTTQPRGSISPPLVAFTQCAPPSGPAATP